MGIEEPIWTSAELAAACGALSARPWYADGVKIDSRAVRPGDLFIALANGDSDGHDHVPDAFDRGAVAALVCKDVPGLGAQDQRLVHVADTMDAMRLMAKHARDRAPAKVIGVTGSSGKADVVHALANALRSAGPVHASEKHTAKHSLVPLSAARMPRETRFGILELGMSGKGHILQGARLVKPDVAVITSVGASAASALHSDMEVAAEKASLLSALPKGGMAIIGIDNPYKTLLMKFAAEAGAMAITVSVVDSADVRPVKMTEHHDCTCLTADVFGTPVTYKIAQPGREWVLKSLMVLAAVKAAGADLGQAAVTLAGLEAQPGRGRVHALELNAGKVSLIDESFNANPLATRSALRRLSISQPEHCGRRIAVLADPADYCDIDDELALSVASDLKKFGVHEVIAFGDRSNELARMAGIRAEQWTEPHEMAEALHARLRPGDAVMIKGAAGVPMHQLVQEVLELGEGERQNQFDPRFSSVIGV